MYESMGKLMYIPHVYEERRWRGVVYNAHLELWSATNYYLVSIQIDM